MNSRLESIVNRENDENKINLTSLMDVFCILIFFILINYSTDVNIVDSTNKLVLPESNSEKGALPALKVTVSKSSLLVENNFVMMIDDIKNSDSLLLKPLSKILELHKKKTMKIGEINREIKFRGKVILQMDKDLDFNILKKIVFTSGQTGFGDISFLVVKKT